MEPHTKALSSSCFHHIRSFKQIRSSLDDGMAVSVASALVSSLLDQVNSILYSLPISVHTLLHSHPLHYSKTSTGYPLNGEYISNWPPWRTRHCTLTSHLTGYLSELLQHYEPTRTLRSSSSCQLSVPRYNFEFVSRAFRISAPKILNLLPASIRNSPSLPPYISSASKNTLFSVSLS